MVRSYEEKTTREKKKTFDRVDCLTTQIDSSASLANVSLNVTRKYIGYTQHHKPHRMFTVLIVTMLITTWLFRITFKSNDTYKDSECDYANLMNWWFNGSCVLALLTIVFEYSIAMHFGSKLESEYYKYCVKNSVDLYANYGENHVFAQDESSEYTIDPVRKQQDMQSINIDDLEPCEQTITTKKISNFLTVFSLVDVAWVLFGLVTIVLATTDSCYDSESDLYSDATFFLVLSFLFYFFRVVFTRYSHHQE